MDLTTTKVIAMLSLGFSSLIIGLLPAWLSKTSRWSPTDSLFRSSLLCFGGGVLLATAILHMLPESREILGVTADVSFCVGFFFIYFVDEIVHLFYIRPVDDLGRSYDTASVEANHGHSHSYGATENTSLLENSESMAVAGCHVAQREPCTRSSAGRGGLLIALTIHAVLEGLAVGLQETVTKVFLLLGAIASHKLVVGFCLGAELIAVESTSMCMLVLAITIFSFGSAVGIGIGMIIDGANTNWSATALGIMQSIAGGTLLYVTLSEVLPRERARWHRGPRFAGCLQYIFCTTGFVIMYFLNKYLDADHITSIMN